MGKYDNQLLQPLNSDRGGLTGIEQGINMYFQQRNEKDKEDRQQKQQDFQNQMALKSSGLIKDQGGGLAYDPYTEKMRAANLAQEENQLPRQKMMDTAGLLEKGVQQTPEGGVGFTPQKLLEQSIGNRLKTAEAKQAEAHANYFNTSKTTEHNAKDITAAQNYLGKDKNYTTAKNMLELSDQAKDVVKAALSNPVAKNNIPTILSNLAGHGQRLHSSTMEQQKGDQSMIERFNQMIQSSGKGTLTPKNAQEMMDFIETMSGPTKKSIENMEIKQAKQFMQSHKGIDLQTARQYITGEVPSQENVMQPQGLIAAPPTGLIKTGGPKPGDIEEGHRYVGGPPGDPRSWEPVQ